MDLPFAMETIWTLLLATDQPFLLMHDIRALMQANLIDHTRDDPIWDSYTMTVLPRGHQYLDYYKERVKQASAQELVEAWRKLFPRDTDENLLHFTTHFLLKVSNLVVPDYWIYGNHIPRPDRTCFTYTNLIADTLLTDKGREVILYLFKHYSAPLLNCSWRSETLTVHLFPYVAAAVDKSEMSAILMQLDPPCIGKFLIEALRQPTSFEDINPVFRVTFSES